MDDDIELVPTHSRLPHPRASARIEFPLLDRFFEKKWEQMVEHDCDDPTAEFCKNSVCYSFPDDEVPKNFKLDDKKSRSSFQHFIKNRGLSYVEKFGDTRGNILPQITQNDDGSYTITIYRRCKAAEFRGRPKAAAKDE